MSYYTTDEFKLAVRQEIMEAFGTLHGHYEVLGIVAAACDRMEMQSAAKAPAAVVDQRERDQESTNINPFAVGDTVRVLQSHPTHEPDVKTGKVVKVSKKLLDVEIDQVVWTMGVGTVEKGTDIRLHSWVMMDGVLGQVVADHDGLFSVRMENGVTKHNYAASDMQFVSNFPERPNMTHGDA